MRDSQPPSDTVSLRDYFERVISTLEQQISLARKEARESTHAQAASLNARLELLNEFRASMNDAATQYAQASTVEQLRTDISEANGRRGAWIAAAAIIATLVSLGVGQLVASSLTSADVSSQIQREAPWNRDKVAIERRISELERRTESLQLQITRLQQNQKVLCATIKPRISSC